MTELKDDCSNEEQQRIIMRRRAQDCDLERTLNEYEKFIRWKAWRYAWRRYGLREDFEQVGREAVVKVYRAIEGGLEVQNQKGYYLNSIKNAMIDFYRKQYRPNCAVWEYDRESGQTRVKRYRYRREWKCRIQYHGDKLKRVEHQYQASLNFEEVFKHVLFFSENFESDG